MTDATGLSGVPETALWTLRNRALEAARPDSAFADPLAVELFAALGSPGNERFGAPSQSHALRASCFDEITRRFLAEHPGGTVVALGEGLQTSFWRIGSTPGRWVSVDLPEIMALRARLLPRDDRIHAVTGSALDRSWMDEVDPAAGVLITAEGLLMYFDPADALALIRDCAARFPGGALVLDAIPAWFSRRTLAGFALTPRYTTPPMPFSLSVEEAAALPRSIPGIASVQDLALPPGRRLWRLAPWIARVPGIRNRRPSIALLRFR